MSTIIGLVSTFRLPLQIHRACSSLLDFLMPSRSFNVQSATLARPFWTSAYLNSASTSNPPLLLIPFGLPRAVSPLQRPIHRVSTSPTKGSRILRSAPVGAKPRSTGPPLWSIGKRERRSSRFLTPFFLWTRGESNPCPKTHSLFFYYHS